MKKTTLLTGLILILGLAPFGAAQQTPAAPPAAPPAARRLLPRRLLLCRSPTLT